MAKIITWSDETDKTKFKGTFLRAVQSAHINFLVGAGASMPGVPAAGNIEAEIEALIDKNDFSAATDKTLAFLKQFVGPTRQILVGNEMEAVKETVEKYAGFILAIDSLLAERKTNLLPKQASVFTTNYDLLLERASESCPSIMLNDGFDRAPRLSGLAVYRPERFFDATLHTGNHYDYTAEIPSINLIKLHGSLGWQRSDDVIVNKIIDIDAIDAAPTGESDKTEELLASAALILPTKRKFRETIIDRTYYDLLRIFANVLERENSILISFGFSFRDAHIQDIVRRALRNPTLLLVIVAYSPDEVTPLCKLFESYNNVVVLAPTQVGDLNFSGLIQLIRECTPTGETSDGN